MKFLNKIYWKEIKDYRKIIHIFGLKLKFSKNYNKMILEEIESLNNSQENLQNKISQIQNNQLNYILTCLSASNQHQKVFPKYKNINQNNDVVLIATGPSLNNFNKIDDAIYVGVNKAFQYNKVKFDYLFLQDYSGITKTYIEDFCNYNAKKFIGYIPDYVENAIPCIIPEKYSFYPNVERYYNIHPTIKKSFTFDIATLPLGDAYSIVFSAMQFILWTNPKRIYLVGCDCSTNGQFYQSTNNLAVKEVIDGWKRMKNFAKIYYPDTEIISINPVGLKGIFKDIYQDEEIKIQ